MDYLTNALEYVHYPHYVVCHCDINHNNWIVGEEGHLYLIDWDGAMVADPALDLGLLLYSYIPEAEWGQWLEQYGVKLDPSLCERMHWYVVSQSISVLLWHFGRQQFEQVEQLKIYIKSLLKD